MEHEASIHDGNLQLPRALAVHLRILAIDLCILSSAFRKPLGLHRSHEVGSLGLVANLEQVG